MSIFKISNNSSSNYCKISSWLPKSVLYSRERAPSRKYGVQSSGDTGDEACVELLLRAYAEQRGPAAAEAAAGVAAEKVAAAKVAVGRAERSDRVGGACMYRHQTSTA